MVDHLPNPSDPAGADVDLFLTYVDFYRERVLAKFSSLPEGERRTSRLASGWSPVELVQHLRYMERRWTEWAFVDGDLPEPWGDRRDHRWYVPDDVSEAETVEALRRQGRRTHEIVTRLGPGARGVPSGRWSAGPGTIERALLHILQEYARHLGQLDVVVELATGVTGE